MKIWGLTEKAERERIKRMTDNVDAVVPGAEAKVELKPWEVKTELKADRPSEIGNFAVLPVGGVEASDEYYPAALVLGGWTWIRALGAQAAGHEGLRYLRDKKVEGGGETVGALDLDAARSQVREWLSPDSAAYFLDPWSGELMGGRVFSPLYGTLQDKPTDFQIRTAGQVLAEELYPQARAAEVEEAKKGHPDVAFSLTPEDFPAGEAPQRPSAPRVRLLKDPSALEGLKQQAHKFLVELGIRRVV